MVSRKLGKRSGRSEGYRNKKVGTAEMKKPKSSTRFATVVKVMVSSRIRTSPPNDRDHDDGSVDPLLSSGNPIDDSNGSR